MDAGVDEDPAADKGSCQRKRHSYDDAGEKRLEPCQAAAIAAELALEIVRADGSHKETGRGDDRRRQLERDDLLRK